LVDLGRLRAVQLYDHAISVERLDALIKMAVAESAWLIFYTHDVDDTPSRYGCGQALLEYAVRAAVASDASVLTTYGAIEAIFRHSNK